MNFVDADMEPLLEPKKFDPSNPEDKKAAVKDALLRYKSVTGKNPFTTNSTVHDLLNDEKAQFSQSTTTQRPSKKGLSHSQQIWVLPSPTTLNHPALRSPNKTEKSITFRTPIKKFVFDDDQNERLLSPGHKRATSQPLPPSPHEPVAQSPTKATHGFAKSLSDTNFFTAGGATRRIARKVTPAKLTLPSSSPAKGQLAAIGEHDDIAANYKVQVRADPDSDSQIVRSPLKRLFGERGILGRSASAKDSPDPRYKKKGLALWGGKVRQRVEEIGKDFSEKLLVVGEAANRRSTAAGISVSTFPVTLSPYVQGDFYMQLELLLNIETNNFLMREFQSNRISVQSVKATVEHWKNKGRPQVLGFRFDIATQRELVGLNADSVQFAGVNAFTKGKVLSVLAVWKVLAKEIAIHTFCQPDSAVKKHLHDAEKVLELIDASPDSMLAFQEMRSRVVTEIYREEKAERERKDLHGVERPWSAEKLND